MSRNRSRRAGFTLPEVLVTVAIVAILAAVVVPTVTNQIGKGDDANLTSNVSSMRTGITAFVSDVRKFPSRVQHLLVKPAAGDSALDGPYGALAVNRWRGPYQTGSLQPVVLSAAADSVLIGHAYVLDVFKDTGFVAPRGYIGVTLSSVASNATALKIDSLIDGATGQLQGNLQWTLTAGVPTNNRLTLLLMGR
jgi:prepilin-type N-terminal cleavage/methylation domain-containing protein